MKRVIFFLALLLLGADALLVSCTSMSAQTRSDLLAQSEALQSQTQLEHQRQEAALSAAIASGDTKAAKKAQDALALLDKLKPLIDQGHDVFSASVGADGQINIQPAAIAIGGAVGGPIGAGLALGLPLLWGALASWQAQRKAGEAKENLAAATSVLKGLDAAAIANPGTNNALDASWKVVDSHLTPLAKELVDTHMTT